MSKPVKVIGLSVTERGARRRPLVVPVRVARRIGLDGFSTTAEGGVFSLDLRGLLVKVSDLADRPTVAHCLWLEGASGVDACEPEWFAHHHPDSAIGQAWLAEQDLRKYR